MRKLLIMASLATALGACTTVVEQPSAQLGRATLQYADGSPAGTVRLIGQGDRVDIAITLTGWSEGRHGMRLHRIGDCSGPDFVSAGEPLQVGGNLPEAIVNASGTANVSATLNDAQMQAMAQIFDSDGTAIVVRQDGSARMACGVFSR